MKAFVICIGHELLGGRAVNTNLAFLGERLELQGWRIHRESCIPDDAAAIRAEVLLALEQADVVVTIGGLGPTSDDVTRPAVAEALGRRLHFDAAVAAGIRAYMGPRMHLVPEEALRVQSMVPDDAEILPNLNGTAPGLCLHSSQGRLVFMLPGPPNEFRPLVETAVIPRLEREFPVSEISETLYCADIGESNAAALAEPILARYPKVAISYCIRPTHLFIRLTASFRQAGLLLLAASELRGALAPHLLGEGCSDLREDIARMLQEQGLVLGTAESCTGGGIARLLTDLPGSSAWFHGGVVTYDNAWKTRLLGVSETLLATAGAVSAEVAEAMLEGLLERHQVQAGIAVTGIAGPSGGSAEKPVGLVYIATGVPGVSSVEHFQLGGERGTIRERAASRALVQLWRNLRTAQALKAGRLVCGTPS